MMRTIYVAIGNSDDKLSQADWAEFVRDVEQAVKSCAWDIHLAGFSAPDKPWQNACWVFGVKTVAEESKLGDILAYLAMVNGQDSIAWAVLGELTFIKPVPLSPPVCG